MKGAADFVQYDSVAWELAKLSRDPALTFKPDPSFRPKFRNPDEIIENDLHVTDDWRCPGSAVSRRWTCAARRRSPKE